MIMIIAIKMKIREVVLVFYWKTIIVGWSWRGRQTTIPYVTDTPPKSEGKAFWGARKACNPSKTIVNVGFLRFLVQSGVPAKRETLLNHAKNRFLDVPCPCWVGREA